MHAMKQVKDFRRENLQRLLTGYRSQRQFADSADLAAAYVSQMVNGTREMGEDVARRIERALGLSMGWMDTDHELRPENEQIDVQILEHLPADQLKLLTDYRRLSPRYQEMLRETAAAYSKLEQNQQQQ